MKYTQIYSKNNKVIPLFNEFRNLPVISDITLFHLGTPIWASKRYIISGARCSFMIEFSELLYVFAAGAILIVALVAYNKFGKVKDQ